MTGSLDDSRSERSLVPSEVSDHPTKPMDGPPPPPHEPVGAGGSTTLSASTDWELVQREPSVSPTHDNTARVGRGGDRRRLVVAACALVVVLIGAVTWWQRGETSSIVGPDAPGQHPFLDVAEPLPPEDADTLNTVLDQLRNSARQGEAGPAARPGDAGFAVSQRAAVEAAQQAGLRVIPPASPVGVGLYGGTGRNACDVSALIGFLTANGVAGAAWAEVEGVDPDQIDNYLLSLESGFLLTDVQVVNHGFKDGKAQAIPNTTLAAGTAVLVDANGIPRVRCRCGNPLLPIPPAANADRLPLVVTLAPAPGETPQPFPLGPPGDVSITLLPGDPASSSEYFPEGSGVDLRTYEVQVTFPSDPPVPLGEIVLPDHIEPDLLREQQSAALAIGKLKVDDTALPTAGLPAIDYCYRDNDPTDVIGGYRQRGGPSDLLLTYGVSVEDGRLVSYVVELSVEGPADLELTKAADDVDLDDCTGKSNAITVWRST